MRGKAQETGGEQAQGRGPPGILTTLPYFRVRYAGQRADIVVACGQVSSDGTREALVPYVPP